MPKEASYAAPYHGQVPHDLTFYGKGKGFDIDINQFVQVNETLFKALGSAASAAVREVMEAAYDQAMEEAPLKTGKLRESIFYDVRNGEGILGTKGCKYGAMQHYHEEYENPTTPGTKPYFILDPLYENAAELQQQVADRIEFVLALAAGRRGIYSFLRNKMGLSRDEARSHELYTKPLRMY